MKKNVLKTIGLCTLVLTMFFIATGFVGLNNGNMSNDNSCTVTVKYSDGSLAKEVKVTTEVSGGISCIGGRDFYTDKEAKVTLKWVSGCYLKRVYVKGTSYKVDYQDGKTYTLTMD
jgi:hypothetical protein